MLVTDDGGKQWTLKKCGNRKTRLVQGSCRLHPTTCPILADFFEKELHQQTTSDWAKVEQLKQNNFFVFLYYIKQIYFRIFHIVVNVFLITFNENEPLPRMDTWKIRATLPLPTYHLRRVLSPFGSSWYYRNYFLPHVFFGGKPTQVWRAFLSEKECYVLQRNLWCLHSKLIKMLTVFFFRS